MLIEIDNAPFISRWITVWHQYFVCLSAILLVDIKYDLVVLRVFCVLFIKNCP